MTASARWPIVWISMTKRYGNSHPALDIVRILTWWPMTKRR